MELRLLTDAGYCEELDLLVNALIDQYVENELSAEDRDRVGQYFLESKERRDKLEFALALKRRKAELLSDKGHRRKALTFYWPIAASVLVLLGLSVVVWQTRFSQPNLSNGLDALQAAFREQRPIEARISGFNYAPVLEQRGEALKVDSVRRDQAASLLFGAVSENPGTATHHALGKYYLAERQFDKAIGQFEAALKFAPQNAQIHSDLGAALLEKGKSHSSEPGREIEEFAGSLEHLQRALELDSSLLEALFNRALLYQHMRLLAQAGSDWRAYLEKDPNSKWADEARQQLLEIEKQQKKVSGNGQQSFQDFFNAYERKDDAQAWEVIRRNYTSAGNAISNTLLDSYLDLETKGESGDAGSKLQALAYVGQLEFDRSGDIYTSDLARFYSGLNPRQLSAHAHARQQMRSGYELFLNSQVNNALSYYAQAKRTFDESGDEGEATFAQYRMGHCYLFQPDLKRSDAIFARLQSASERSNYKWLLSQSLYRTASVRLAYNEYSESIDYAHRALKQSEQIQDIIGILKALVLLADQYRSLHNERQSLNFLHRALDLTNDAAADPLQTWGIFTAIALNLNSLNLRPAALEYQKEALRLALEMDRPLIISRSYDYLGLTYGSLKNYDLALQNINLAFAAGNKLSGEPSGLEMMANSSLHAGDIYRQSGDYHKAVESYDRSIQLYEELNYPYFAYPARKGKFLCYIAQGDDSTAEEELRTVLGLFEQYRSKLTGESQRNTFFDAEQSIYDLAIDFAQTRKQNPQLAFEYSELSRARSLLDAMRRSTQVAEGGDSPELHLSSNSTPLTLTDIQRRMPEQAQIIQYAVLDDRLLIWVVTRTNISTREVTLNSDALNEKVRGYLRAMLSTHMEAEAARDAKELYDILIKPIEPLLDKTKVLCIVPDKVLHFLPFCALVSQVTGKYLVEEFRLQQSPSATIFVDCSEQAVQKTARTDERLLSIGDPSFDGGAFPTLRRLPSAGREAEAITAFYKPHRLLLRDNAREPAVKSEIVKANVAHFALHYVVDERFSLLSKMVLATGRGGDARNREDDGVWQIHEIYKMRLPLTRLVILSACQTGIEQQYRGEGAVSMARPFITAGVPLVVASLWPVDSQSTERLMVSFHRYRTRDRFPTAEALRRAQLELLGGQDTRYRQPYYWAAFTAIGGYTEY